MPALNFQARFASLVESGRKRQTIRPYRKDGRDPKPGETLYLYTGMRTKVCRKLGEATCSSIYHVTIRKNEIWLYGGLNFRSLDDFARADGFRNFSEMEKWFERYHKLPFSGMLIQWKTLRKTHV